MTVTISHHSSPGPDDEGYAASLGDDVLEDVQDLEEFPGSFDLMLSTALLHVQARCAVDPRAAKLETWEAVVTATQISSAVFAVTGVSEGTVQCRIAQEVRTLAAIGPRDYADAGNWLTAFWLAVIRRDQKRLTLLCEVPLDQLRSSGGSYDEYVHHWVAALQAYWLQRPELDDELTQAFQGSHPDAARVAPRALLENILYPPINLFYRFLRQDGPGFNQALVEAVELHKATGPPTTRGRTAPPHGRPRTAGYRLSRLRRRYAD
ncbi:immunity 49 family protein [Streptomyces sp. NPDC093018]|uniref:immunity 49 family protein n=1 Tax=Streptomyces sp. NPDC093018 TaxID=3155067 RepID=UPI00341A2C2A